MQTDAPAGVTIATRLSTTLEGLIRGLRSITTAGGVSSSSASVLGRLSAEGPQRITDLAHAEHVSQPGATQLVARMEAEGMVRRGPSDEDRRSTIVTLTAHGRQVLDARRAQRRAMLERLLDRLGADDAAAIAAALPALERLAAGAAEHAVPHDSDEISAERRG